MLQVCGWDRSCHAQGGSLLLHRPLPRRWCCADTRRTQPAAERLHTRGGACWRETCIAAGRRRRQQQTAYALPSPRGVRPCCATTSWLPQTETQPLPLPPGAVRSGAHVLVVLALCTVNFALCSSSLAPRLTRALLSLMPLPPLGPLADAALRATVSDGCAAAGVAATLALASRAGHFASTPPCPRQHDKPSARRLWLRRCAALLCALLCFPGLSWVVAVSTGTPGDGMPWGSATAAAASPAPPGLLAFLPLLLLVAPAWEEALFRGFLLRALLTMAGAVRGGAASTAAALEQRQGDGGNGSAHARLWVATAGCIALASLAFAGAHFAGGGAGGWTPPTGLAALRLACATSASALEGGGGGGLFVPLCAVGLLLGAVFVATSGDTVACALVHGAWNAWTFVCLLYTSDAADDYS
jgi:membrane protease YdiL (CAAX protease family)